MDEIGRGQAESAQLPQRTPKGQMRVPGQRGEAVARRQESRADGELRIKSDHWGGLVIGHWPFGEEMKTRILPFPNDK